MAGSLDSLLFEGDGHDVIFHLSDTHLTRTELRNSAGQLTELLTAQDVGAGHVVLGVVPSSPASIPALFGAWRAGATYAPTNPRLTDSELVGIIEELRPAALLVSAELADRVAIMADGPAVLVVDGLAWEQQRPARGDRRHVDPGIALVLFTSGTTGRPKPVMLRRKTLLDAMEAVLATIRTGVKPATDAGAEPRATHSAMPNLVPFPLYLWSGIYNMCFALRTGSELVAMPQFQPALFADLIRQYGIRSVVVAPAMIAALLDSTVDDLSPLRFVRNGTAPLSVPLARRFRNRFGVTVLNGYGQTELGGEVLGWNAGDAREFGESKLGSVGRPHPGVDIRFLDDESVDVAPGQTGEICVKSPFVMAGYLTGTADDRLTADGYLRTGDLGHVDDDGFVWLDGRRSDVINRSGLKVYPDEVEEVLRTDAGVADVAVAGVADERLGEVPWAFVVPTLGTDVVALREALDAVARQYLAPYKVPAGYSWLEALPRNDVGKILRRELPTPTR